MRLAKDHAATDVRQNVGGRPKNPWTSSRKRKLVRLYLMTSLTMPKICDLLATDEFRPCLRDIQTQLTKLLPNRDKGHGSCRPLRNGQSKNRFKTWKKCRLHLISTHTSLKLRHEERRSTRSLSSTGSENTLSIPKDVSVTLSTSLNPYYNPLSHWDFEMTTPHGIPTHVSMPDISQLYSSQLDPTLIQKKTSEDFASDKEVSISPSTIINYREDNSVMHGSESNPFISAQRSEDPNHKSHEISNPPNRNPSRITTRTISTRVSSHLSNSIRYANSVLSATNSFRSSLVSAMGPLSKGSSTKSKSISVSASDEEWWNMAMDESSMTLGSSSKSHERRSARSLLERPCCGLSLPFLERNPAMPCEICGSVLPFDRSCCGLDHALADLDPFIRCEICGFAFAHNIARHDRDLLYLKGVGDIFSQDKFGNTALHHAAAAGNSRYIKSVLMSIEPHAVLYLGTRNSSGETFVHVLQEPMDVFSALFPAHLEIHALLMQRTTDYFGKSFVDNVLTLKSFVQSNTDNDNEARNLWFEELVACNSIKRELKFAAAIKGNHIYLRDSSGCTGLTVAASLGLRKIVVALLRLGANPNTRRNNGTIGISTLSRVVTRLNHAKNTSNDALHAKILSCATTLADAGAKASPSETEEYHVSQWLPKELFIADKRTSKSLKSVVTDAAARVIKKGLISQTIGRETFTNQHMLPSIYSSDTKHIISESDRHPILWEETAPENTNHRPHRFSFENCESIPELEARESPNTERTRIVEPQFSERFGSDLSTFGPAMVAEITPQTSFPPYAVEGGWI